MRKTDVVWLLASMFPFVVTACEPDDDFMPEGEIVVSVDTLFVADTIINNDDTIIKIDTIIKKDTIVNSDNNKSPKLKFTYYMDQNSSGVSVQGAAIYNNYLFEFSPSMSCVFIYDLKRKEFIQSVTLLKNEKDHFNNASFGLYHNTNDEFPLLYLSGGDSTYNPVIVYRITLNESIFVFDKIQEFTLPESTENNKVYWASTVIDSINEFLYSYSYYNGDVYLSKYAIPDYTFNNVPLSDSDILENVRIDSFINKQGATIKNNYIYILTGIPGQETTTLRVYNLDNKKRIYSFPLKDFGYNFEPEGIGFYEDKMIITSQGGKGIYQVEFINFRL